MRIAIYMTLPAEEVQSGWNGDVDELEGSIRATLHELVGDDGQVYVPRVFGIEADTEDEQDQAVLAKILGQDPVRGGQAFDDSQASLAAADRPQPGDQVRAVAIQGRAIVQGILQGTARQPEIRDGWTIWLVYPETIQPIGQEQS
jgi:hypothetical protein